MTDDPSATALSGPVPRDGIGMAGMKWHVDGTDGHRVQAWLSWGYPQPDLHGPLHDVGGMDPLIGWVTGRRINVEVSWTPTTRTLIGVLIVPLWVTQQGNAPLLLTRA